MKSFQNQDMPDIIPMILKEKIKEIRLEKHNGSTFGPWLTLKDPSGDAQMKKIYTQNVPISFPLSLKKNIKNLTQKT